MLITSSMLDEANYRVTSQLRSLGLYSPGMAAVDTRLVPFSWQAYGWKYRGKKGEIHIPAIALSRLGTVFGYPRVGLREVIRHEFGHALVDIHPRLFRTQEFRDAFGASVDCQDPWEYDPDFFVSRYASTCPEEDFCETFMVCVGRSLKTPPASLPPAVRRKMRFVASLPGRIRREAR